MKGTFDLFFNWLKVFVQIVAPITVCGPQRRWTIQFLGTQERHPAPEIFKRARVMDSIIIYDMASPSSKIQ